MDRKMDFFSICSRMESEIRCLKADINTIERMRISSMLQSFKDDESRLKNCINFIQMFHSDMFVLPSAKGKPGDDNNAYTTTENFKYWFHLSKSMLSKNEPMNELESALTMLTAEIPPPLSALSSPDYLNDGICDIKYASDSIKDDNVQPYGDNVQPYGDNVQPYGDNVQPFGDNDQPCGGNVQPFRDNDQPFRDNDQPFGDNDQPFEDNDQPFGDNDQPFRDNDQPFRDNDQPFEDNDQPFEDNDQPFGDNDQPCRYSYEPNFDYELCDDNDQPCGDNHQPSGDNHQPSGDNDQTCDDNDKSCYIKYEKANDTEATCFDVCEPISSSSESSKRSRAGSSSSMSEASSGRTVSICSNRSEPVEVNIEPNDQDQEWAANTLLKLMFNQEEEISKLLLHLLSKFSRFQQNLRTAEAKVSELGEIFPSRSNVDLKIMCDTLRESVLYLDKTVLKINAKYSEILGNFEEKNNSKQ